MLEDCDEKWNLRGEMASGLMLRWTSLVDRADPPLGGLWLTGRSLTPNVLPELLPPEARGLHPPTLPPPPAAATNMDLTSFHHMACSYAQTVPSFVMLGKKNFNCPQQLTVLQDTNVCCVQYMQTSDVL